MTGRRLGCVLSLIVGATPLKAQGHEHLRDRIQDLFSFGSCGKPLCLDASVNAANGHGEHFIPALSSSNGAIIGFLTEAIAVNASSAPLSASSSGTTFKFVNGVPVVGANLSGLDFNSLRGVPLDKLVLNFTHQDVPGVGLPGLGDPERENDILQVRMQLSVNLKVSTFFATYGISDRVDISVAVPLVHTSLEGRSQAQIYPFGPTVVHFFTGTPANPGLTANAATFGSSTGIGDIALRFKANVRSNERIGLALLADARLPTGSEEDLTGSGHLALRGLAILSGRFGDFSPHLNLGYMVRGGAGRNDAVLATGGFDQPISGWATLAVEVLSEWETGASALKIPETVTLLYPFVRTVEPTNIPEMRDHRVNGSVGFKFRTPGGPILVTNALVPLRRGGLQSSLIWTVGLDMNF
jgi:hypothetical protein